MQDYFRKTIKMNIQLLSISHKTARASLRGRFVFDSEQTKDILKQLTEPDGQQENTGIEEAVLISTCNRTELYCSGTPENQNFIRMQHVLLAAAGIEKTAKRIWRRWTHSADSRIKTPYITCSAWRRDWTRQCLEKTRF